MDFFENYAIVTMQSDNITFYACKIIKHFFSPGGTNIQKTAEMFFSNTNNSTTLKPTGPPAPVVSREVKLSTEFEFGSLVH